MAEVFILTAIIVWSLAMWAVGVAVGLARANNKWLDVIQKYEDGINK